MLQRQSDGRLSRNASGGLLKGEAGDPCCCSGVACSCGARDCLGQNVSSFSIAVSSVSTSGMIAAATAGTGNTAWTVAGDPNVVTIDTPVGVDVDAGSCVGSGYRSKLVYNEWEKAIAGQAPEGGAFCGCWIPNEPTFLDDITTPGWIRFEPTDSPLWYQTDTTVSVSVSGDGEGSRTVTVTITTGAEKRLDCALSTVSASLEWFNASTTVSTRECVVELTNTLAYGGTVTITFDDEAPSRCADSPREVTVTYTDLGYAANPYLDEDGIPRPPCDTDACIDPLTDCTGATTPVRDGPSSFAIKWRKKCYEDDITDPDQWQYYGCVYVSDEASPRTVTVPPNRVNDALWWRRASYVAGDVDPGFTYDTDGFGSLGTYASVAVTFSEETTPENCSCPDCPETPYTDGSACSTQFCIRATIEGTLQGITVTREGSTTRWSGTSGDGNTGVIYWDQPRCRWIAVVNGVQFISGLWGQSCPNTGVWKGVLTPSSTIEIGAGECSDVPTDCTTCPPKFCVSHFDRIDPGPGGNRPRLYHTLTKGAGTSCIWSGTSKYTSLDIDYTYELRWSEAESRWVVEAKNSSGTTAWIAKAPTAAFFCSPTGTYTLTSTYASLADTLGTITVTEEACGDGIQFGVDVTRTMARGGMLSVLMNGYDTIYDTAAGFTGDFGELIVEFEKNGSPWVTVTVSDDGDLVEVGTVEAGDSIRSRTLTTDPGVVRDVWYGSYDADGQGYAGSTLASPSGSILYDHTRAVFPECAIISLVGVVE